VWLAVNLNRHPCRLSAHRQKAHPKPPSLVCRHGTAWTTTRCAGEGSRRCPTRALLYPRPCRYHQRHRTPHQCRLLPGAPSSSGTARVALASAVASLLPCLQPHWERSNGSRCLGPVGVERDEADFALGRLSPHQFTFTLNLTPPFTLTPRHNPSTRRPLGRYQHPPLRTPGHIC
jgi:hypothetical protein